MSVFTTIFVIGIVFAFLFVYFKAFQLFIKLEAGCDFLLRPVDRLSKLTLFDDSKIPYAKIIRLSILGLVTLASCIYILVSLIVSASFEDLIQGFMDETSIMQLAYLITGVTTAEESFSYSALAGIGLSSFLSFLYMRLTVDALKSLSLPKPLYWILLVLFNLAFISISCPLTDPMTHLCVSIADTTQSVYLSLADAFNSGTESFWGIVKTVSSGLVLFLLLYVVFLLFMIAVREFLANILYGILSISLAIALTLLFDSWAGFPEWISLLLCSSALFLPDYIRADEHVKEKFVLLIKNLF